MSHPHHLGHGASRHVCMMEGPDPEVALSTLQFSTIQEENKRYSEEIKRLKQLLAANGVSYIVESLKNDTNKIANGPGRRSKAIEDSTQNNDNKPLPHLPNEIILRILGFAVKSSVPVIDPFYKLRRDNVTRVERSSRKGINLNFLATSKSFRVEGIRLLVESNDFVFTQAVALENFSKISGEMRSTIKHVTMRVVGRYYDDDARKANLDGNGCYHDTVPKFMVPVAARPKGMVRDKGVQAYCWYQLADFLRTLRLPFDPISKDCPKLFPGLLTMRLDLVNFCDHLPLGLLSFASIVRWNIGHIVDELLITGSPEVDMGSDEEQILRNLLRDEGLFSTGCPTFISIKNGLKSLPGYGLSQQVVRANKCTIKSTSRLIHPEGGKHPKSLYPPGHTIWKWTTDYHFKPKKWIEFDRETGFPMDEIDIWSDMYGNSDYDSDGIPYDQEDEGDDEPKDEDAEDDMPALVELPEVPAL